MTSLFSRLQKLNKEATGPQWYPQVNARVEDGWMVMARDNGIVADLLGETNAALIVECRNSLPAVLNLIEAAQRLVDTTEDRTGSRYLADLREAVAVFVSGARGTEVTPDQLVWQAADRVLKMNYPNDLTEEERLERYVADASLVAAFVLELQEEQP